MGKSIQQMREAISRCYDGFSWKDKCLHKMPTAQVWAVYHKFIKEGKLDKNGRPTRFQVEYNKLNNAMNRAFALGKSSGPVIVDEWLSEQTPTGEQMTIFDFMKN